MVNFPTSQNLAHSKAFLNTKTLIVGYQFLQSFYESLEKGEVACGVLLDQSEAFDCLGHNILLGRLQTHETRGTIHKWFVSYLEGRP